MAKKGQIPAGMQSGLGELWSRLRFVLIAVIVYRIGAHIPVPGSTLTVSLRCLIRTRAPS